MRTQLSRRGYDKALEIQHITAGDSVLLHLTDGLKITVEQEQGSTVTISVHFNHERTTGVQVYDGEGEYLGIIRPFGYSRGDDDD